jgi:hypothetical protein
MMINIDSFKKDRLTCTLRFYVLKMWYVPNLDFNF